ncbi:MAG: protein phosphatase [Clostridia bacterium]|nr:protein phosphatase [Clostridia bacterium]
MNEEMDACKLIKDLAEENQTRKILEMINDCKSLEEAKVKIKALLNK